MHRCSRVAVFCLILAALSVRVYPNDRRFAYTYETSVLPPGEREIETWNTYRSGREYFYSAVDQRVEYEFGVTTNLMSAFYLNYSSSVQDSAGASKTGLPLSSTELGFSSEWKYKLMDRVADPFGAALYGELSKSPTTSELEGKLLIDKDLGDLLLAFNAITDREWHTVIERGIASTEAETELEFDAGASFRLTDRLSVGAELHNTSEFEEGEIEHSPLFVGIVAAYEAPGWWAAVSFMPQAASFGEEDNGSLDLQSHEKYEARILLSFHL